MPSVQDPRAPAFPDTPGWGPANLPVPGTPLPTLFRTDRTAARASWIVPGGVRTGTTYDVQRSTNGGAWAGVGTGLGPDPLDLAADPGDTVAVRVRAREGALASPWSLPAPLDMDVGEAAPTASGTAAGGATVLDPLTKRVYAAATGAGGLELRESNYGTMARTRTLDLSGTPLTRLDVLSLDPGSGGWLYGLEVGNHYLIAVDLRLWDKVSGVDPAGPAFDASGLGAADVVRTYDLASLAGVVSLSGGITASPADRAVYVSAYGVGGPDVVELTKGWTEAGAGDLTVSRVLTLAGVGGARAGGLALDPAARKLYAATTSTGTTGRVAAVNIDSLLQTGQASFPVADGAGNYRTNGTVVDGQAYFASDSEASSLARVGADLTAAALPLEDFGWARGLFATPDHLYLGGQDTDTGVAGVRKLSLADLSEVARIVVGDPLRPLLDAVAASPASITVTWNDPFAGHGRGWVVRRSVSSSEGPWENVATVSSDTTTYTDTGLDADKTYWYQVQAVRLLNAEDLAPLFDPFTNVLSALAGLAGSLYGFAQAYSQEQEKAALTKKALGDAPSPPADGGGIAFWGGRDSDLADFGDRDNQTNEFAHEADGTVVVGAGFNPTPLLQAIAGSLTDKANQVADWWDHTLHGETTAAEASRKAYWAAYRQALTDNGVLPNVLHWRLKVGGVDLMNTTGSFAALRKENDAYSAEAVAADPAAADRGRRAGTVDGALYHVGMMAAPLVPNPARAVVTDAESSLPRLTTDFVNYDAENVAVLQVGRKGSRLFSKSADELALLEMEGAFPPPANGRPGHPEVIASYGLQSQRAELVGFSWYFRKVPGIENNVLVIVVENGSGRLGRGVSPADFPGVAAEIRKLAGVGTDVGVVVHNSMRSTRALEMGPDGVMKVLMLEPGAVSAY